MVLSNVTAGLRPGRMTAIMGPSGAGKTTLMTTLAGEALGRACSVACDDGSCVWWCMMHDARMHAKVAQ